MGFLLGASRPDVADVGSGVTDILVGQWDVELDRGNLRYERFEIDKLLVRSPGIRRFFHTASRWDMWCRPFLPAFPRHVLIFDNGYQKKDY